MRLLIVFAVILASACAPAYRRVAIPIAVGCVSADVGSTVVALRVPGNYETNRLTGPHPSPLRVIATASGEWGGLIFLGDKAATEHPKIATAFLVGLSSMNCVMAAKNARVR